MVRGGEKASIRLHGEIDKLAGNFQLLIIRQRTLKASWVMPFERNSQFIGREPQLTQLEEKAFSEDRTTKIAITGLGGVGKTQIAIELAFRTRAKYENCSIIWIPAINIESLQQAYLDVARQGTLARKLQASGSWCSITLTILICGSIDLGLRGDLTL